MDDDARDLSTHRWREVRYNGRELEDLPSALKQEPHATGTVVLFGGPAGTGKTMAAEALAKSLGMELLRVNMSEVVSKYIGETEKNIDRIFSDAEKAGAVLFLDEADALFGQRSDVKDSHDRYATREVAYLLQRIEALQGVVLLSSNDPEASRAIASKVRRARTVVVR